LHSAAERCVRAMGIAALLCCTMVHAERTVDASLRKAAAAGDVSTIETLLAQGADPDKADALLAAVQNAQARALQYMLEHGVDPNAWIRGRDNLPPGAYGSPVFQAAKLGDRQLLKELKKHGADMNAASIERTKPPGDTPLIVASRSGELGAAQLLLEFGADANHRNPSGATALMEALSAPSNALGLVVLLLKFGADPDIKDSGGKSARETSNWYGAAGIKEAIEKARPVKPFTRPEDVERIREVLLYKAGCDFSKPGYMAQTRAMYARWRRPRAQVIHEIESNPEFQARRAGVVESVQQALRAPQNTPEFQDSAREYHLLCDRQLLDEFSGRMHP
jgi:Ankyrin repeats (3 copies)